jgi:hypothetical protein
MQIGEERKLKMRKYLLVILLIFLIVLLTPILVQAEFREDIINFNNQNTRVVNARGSWKVAGDNKWLLDFGSNQAQANQALQVIRFYRLNQQCFVGRPKASMGYYLVNGQAPVGPMAGEDSIYFDNSKLRVVYQGSRWKIVEGRNHALLDFEGNESEAWTALRIIWKYDFSYICFVGRPNAPMTYFRR